MREWKKNIRGLKYLWLYPFFSMWWNIFILKQSKKDLITFFDVQWIVLQITEITFNLFSVTDYMSKKSDPALLMWTSGCLCGCHQAADC